jgi:Fic family protein
MAEYCRKMELKYDLKQVLSPRRYLTDEKRNIPRMDTRKEKLRENIRECLSTSKNYSEFESKIRQRGYEIIKGRGILFIDKQAVKVKGSEVGYSLQKIEKILDLKQQLHQVKDDKIKQEQGREQRHGQHMHLHKQYLQDKITWVKRKAT